MECNPLKKKELRRMNTFVRILSAVIFVVLWVGCSKPPAAEALKNAQDAEEYARRTLDSLQALKIVDSTRAALQPAMHFKDVLAAYTRLVEDYPGAPEAEVALFRRAGIRNNYTKEHDLAVADYGLYARRYPDNEKTPLVMFLVGYIFNNELHQIDSAAAAYKRFLERFPDNEMAPSAQFELSTLGKSPDELLPPEPPVETRAPRKPVAKKGT
jgi:tetratricopeptide (TPR) repeat protein